MPRLTLVALTAALAASACAVAPTDVAKGERIAKQSQDARVSLADATRAYQIINNRFYNHTNNYLPFLYGPDGCYARALYMSMELAVEGIPSSAQYIVAGASTSLQPLTSLSPQVRLKAPDTGFDVTWGWHVVPMLQVNGQRYRTIIDPALLAGPRSIRNWISYVHPVKWGKGYPQYRTPYTQGSTYLTPGTPGDPTMISSFAQLKPFKKSDIQHACRVMNHYLGCAAWKNASLLDKRDLLATRTDELVDLLDDKGKLLDDMPGVDIDCDPPGGGYCKEMPEPVEIPPWILSLPDAPADELGPTGTEGVAGSEGALDAAE